MEQKTEQHIYFSRKKLIIILVCTFLAIVLFVVNFLFVLNIKWNNFFGSIGKSFTHANATGWFFGLFMFFIIAFFVNYWPRKLRMDRMGIKLTFIEEINFSMAIFFMNLISPSVFLSDAYILFFLKSKKLNNIKASAIVLSQEMVSQVSMLFFSLPSFIYVSCYANDIINSGYGFAYALMIIGLGIDLFALSLTFILGKSTRAQFAISIAFNWFKKLFRIKYHTKSEIRENILNKATVRNEVSFLIRQWKDTSLIFLMILAYSFVRYIVMYFAFGMLTFSQDNIANGQSGIALWSFFNVASTATMATRFIPIPGSAITIEKVLQDFLHVSQFNYFFDQFGQPIPPNQVGENFINNGVLLYRCAVLYIPAIVGLPFFLWFFIMGVLRMRKFKK